jgi:hypothetical protein
MQFNKEGVLLLRGLNTKLTKDLPADLQKLRCKVIKQILIPSTEIFILSLFNNLVY